jgi:glycosyltransferase involved in cell wall biosynthesis
MKVAYVTDYDAQNIRAWSGTAYYIGKSLMEQSVDVYYFGPLKQRLLHRLTRKLKRHYHELFNKRYLKDPEPIILNDFARQVEAKLAQTEVDVILSATVNPIAYLNTRVPIIFWADATFANTAEFYPAYSNLCQETLHAGHRMEQEALKRASLAIYSSDWAAQTAIHYYNADPEKVRILPFGANISESRDYYDIKNFIKDRPADQCKLLFIGVEWHRKGGDTAFKVARALNQLGLKTELTVVGCQPELDQPLPDFVKPLGFISKSTPEGFQKINQLIAQSHFLILPSLADCTPIVLCEANSWGVPCLSTQVGGIPSIIHDNKNGKLFDIPANIDQYCGYIKSLFDPYSNYIQLAESAFKEYQARLNWHTAGEKLRDYLCQVLETV